jgi:fermentation-respiration switch protein FrsA (DUF1100 family)
VKKILLTLAAVLFTLYVAACGYMYFRQQSLVFNPSREDVALSVGEVPRAENLQLATADGETLKAWWVAPRSGHPVYLYLHGNAGNLRGSFNDPHGRATRFEGLTREGAGLLALSWRGFGGSSGSPSEAGFHVDAETAASWLREQHPESKVIVFGESLGSGVAVQLAAKQEFAALVLDSPYTSIDDVGTGRYPWLPVRLLSKYPFESEAFAPQVTEPVLIQHCREDRQVPYEQGRRMFAALGSAEKLLRTVEGVCHVPSILTELPLLRELESRFTQKQEK